VRETREETGLNVWLAEQLDVLEHKGRIEHVFLASKFRGTLRLGGPELARMTEDNQYHLLWLDYAQLQQLKLRPKNLLMYCQEWLCRRTSNGLMNLPYRQLVRIAMQGWKIRMSKAFTRENDEAEDDLPAEQRLPASSKNYITPGGWLRLKDELYQLVNKERPEVVQIVNWAASNGDRSENGDYLYGKRRLREIDRRIRFLTKRLELAEVVDPEAREATDQVFFSATVLIERGDGSEQLLRIVGVDEIDLSRGHISWISPIARTLIKAREGDTVLFRGPDGDEDIEILEVRYEKIS
jgi:transcription elongation factor GreB